MFSTKAGENEGSIRGEEHQEQTASFNRFAKDWLCNRYQSQEMDWGSAAPEQKVPIEERRQTSMQAKFMCSKFM